jgi:hypothetical protein
MGGQYFRSEQYSALHFSVNILSSATVLLSPTCRDGQSECTNIFGYVQCVYRLAWLVRSATKINAVCNASPCLSAFPSDIIQGHSSCQASSRVQI